MSEVDPGGTDSRDVARIACTAGPSFGRRVVELAPGAELAFDPAIWRDAIVFVLAGEVEVRCAGGASHRFGPGDIVCFTRLPVRTLCNGGAVPVRLLAIWRHAAQR
jgi:quercetin dioxygenase-like cupin family protein